MSLRNLLNTTIDIKRRTDTAPASGAAGTTTWAALHSGVKCRFNALSSREANYLHDKLSVWANFYVFIEYLSDIREGDRVYSGTTAYEIKMIQDWDRQNNYQKLAVVEIGRP